MISIVIPHYNQPDLLRTCLEALVPQLQGDEIIVVDNASDQPPDSVISTFPQVNLARESTPGPGPARNLGAALAKGEVLAFLDGDCVVDAGWLAAIRAEMARAPGVLGGDVRIRPKDAAKVTIWEAYESQYAYRMDRYIAREGFSGTGNLAMPKSVFAEVGGFAGIGVAEDRDWGLRALAKGHKTRFAPNMRVWHPPLPGFDLLARKWARQTGHQYADHRSRRFGRLKWALRTLAMPLSPLAEIPAIARSNRIPGGAQGRLLCFAGLVKIRLTRFVLMIRVLFSDDPDRLAKRWRKD